MLQPPRHDQHSAPSSPRGHCRGYGGWRPGLRSLSPERFQKAPPGPKRAPCEAKLCGDEGQLQPAAVVETCGNTACTQALRQPCVYFPPTAGWEEAVGHLAAVPRELRASTDTRRRHRHGARPQPAHEQKRQGQTHHAPSHSHAMTAKPHGHLSTPLSCTFHMDQLHSTQEPYAVMRAVGKPRAPPMSAAWVPTHVLSALPASLLGPACGRCVSCTEPTPSEMTLPQQAAPGQAQAMAQAASWHPCVTEVLTGAADVGIGRHQPVPLPASVVCPRCRAGAWGQDVGVSLLWLQGTCSQEGWEVMCCGQVGTGTRSTAGHSVVTALGTRRTAAASVRPTQASTGRMHPPQYRHRGGPGVTAGTLEPVTKAGN